MSQSTQTLKSPSQRRVETEALVLIDGDVTNPGD
jgi:hypothetical protein